MSFQKATPITPGKKARCDSGPQKRPFLGPVLKRGKRTMKNEYAEMRERHQKAFNEWTEGKMFFAFSREQFNSGMREIGLDPEKDTDKIYSSGAGGYYRKTDSEELHALMKRHSEELEEAMKADKTGEGFIYQAFRYELANHEYCYTGDITDTLDALNLTEEEVKENPAMLHGMKKAIRAYSREQAEECE